MKPKFPIGVFAILVLMLALGAWQSARVQHLRQADAFYHWILGAATSERLFEEDDGEEFGDFELMQQISTLVDDKLPPIPETGDGAQAQTKLGAAVLDETHNPLIWEYASGPLLADARAQFLNLSRTGKLQFANTVQYAQISGANVSIFNLFFGFRKLAANFVWLQVDRFWHQGMMQRMIPLMKTCVTLDPNFVDAYILGAWHLGYNVTAQIDPTPQPLKQFSEKYQVCLGERERFYYEAIEYLKDGIRNNPRNYKLYFDLGFGIYKEKLHDYDNATKYLTEAVRQKHERWVPRQLYICMGLAGQYENAINGWREYAQMFPDNEVAPRFIVRNEAMLWEERANENFARATQSADTAEKEKIQAEADALLAKAKELWSTLDDVYAKARLRLLDAKKMAENGRYLESIAMLDHARWESGSIFDEASGLIIEFKQRGNIPLSKSEAMAVLRQENGDACIGSPPGYVEKKQKSVDEG